MLVAKVLEVLHRVLCVSVDNVSVSDSFNLVSRMEVWSVGHVKQES